jgi:DMSO reductase anchor subunit
MNQHGHAPLVVFTSLAIAGGGIVAADAVLLGMAHVDAARPVIAAGSALQAIALLVSLLHLGRARRAPLAARRIGRSPLSNEILMAGAALASSLAILATDWREPAPPVWRAAAGLLCAGYLLAIGLVYRLRGQLTWVGPAALTPMSAGCAFGAACIQACAVSPDGVPRGVIFLLGADAAIFLLRWQEAAPIDGPAKAAGSSAFWRRRHQWFLARFALLDVLPMGLLFFHPTPIVIVSAACGVIVDRLAFYGAAVQRSTEREVDRVDEDVRNASERPHGD